MTGTTLSRPYGLRAETLGERSVLTRPTRTVDGNVALRVGRGGGDAWSLDGRVVLTPTEAYRLMVELDEQLAEGPVTR